MSDDGFNIDNIKIICMRCNAPLILESSRNNSDFIFVDPNCKDKKDIGRHYNLRVVVNG